MNKVTYWVIAVVSGLGFFTLAFFVTTGQTQIFDESIMEKVYTMRIPPINTLAETLTYLGNPATIVVICLVLLALENTRKKFGIPVTIIAIVTSLTNKVIKTIVARPRPEAAMALISESGYSFPSGHAVTSLALYGIIAYLIFIYYIKDKEKSKDKNKMLALAIVMGILAVVIGLTRIYIGVHYPTDVLGGWLEGIFLTFITVAIMRKYKLC